MSRQIELHQATVRILEDLRSGWFPNEKNPMSLEEFIYTLACAVQYNHKRKKSKPWVI
jgi:hypothetical protein